MGGFWAVVFVIAVAIDWALLRRYVNSQIPEIRDRARRHIRTLLLITAVPAATIMFVIIETLVVIAFLNPLPEERGKHNFFVSSLVILAVCAFMGLFISMLAIVLTFSKGWGKTSRLTPCESCGNKAFVPLAFCSGCDKVVCEKCSPGCCKLCGNGELMQFKNNG